MASVWIYPEHKELLDQLISTSKVGSAAGATKTGPFKEQREAYVFAASIGLALGEPSKAEDLASIPRRKKTEIRDTVFMGTSGADELSYATKLIVDEMGRDSIDQLHEALSSISQEALPERLSVLDRFAHAGFNWLLEMQEDSASITDLVLSAIREVQPSGWDQLDGEIPADPLFELL